MLLLLLLPTDVAVSPIFKACMHAIIKKVLIFLGPVTVLDGVYRCNSLECKSAC